jgi:hypothetical protein
VDAVDFLADHAWKLLPLYRFDPRSGLWHHRERPRRPPLTLAGFPYGEAAAPGRLRLAADESLLAGQLEEAGRIVADIEADPPTDAAPAAKVSETFERLRWFPLPHEALTALAQLRMSEAARG